MTLFSTIGRPMTTMLGAALSCVAAQPAAAEAVRPVTTLSYADLATLADATPFVIRAKIKDQIALPVERAPGLAPGRTRLFVEAQTIAVLSGTAAVPESLRYLVDMPVDAKGRAPKLKKQEVIVFARPVAGRPGELQLVTPQAQLAYTPALEAQLRPVLADFAKAGAPPRITGVRDVLSSAGNLAGESETQIFLATAKGEPAALTIVRRPGMAPRWGVSWTELVDQAATAPAKETIAWYRLACALPPSLPQSANLASDAADRARASQDYRFVIEQLGPCARNLG